jgi:DNA invertase Pin-like site-specific DNA recombinase
MSQRNSTDPPPAIPAVIYAAKSTEDRHGSIPTQLDDCRSMAAREEWVVVAEYTDEGFSAYRGNRGPGLAAARRNAAAAAGRYGTPAMLVAQHSDRFSRGAGDRPGASEALVEIWHHERRRDVHLRSVQDDFDLRSSATVANIGERNRADSERKSRATRDGKRRRFARQEAMGPVHDGYRLAPRRDVDGAPVIDGSRVVFDRVPCPDRAPVIQRIFEMLESGMTFGDVSRRLNREGIRTVRGKQWTTRRVRETARDPYYAGWVAGYGERVRGHHEPLIAADRWERLQGTFGRMDPVAVARRAGGRPGSDDYILRGIARCGRCGESFWTRSYAATGRTYVCASVLGSTGTCDAPKIPASNIEFEVLQHLEFFVGDVAAWIADIASAKSRERVELAAAADRERERVVAARRGRDRMADHHADLVADGDPLARTVLRQLARAEAAVDDAERCLRDAEARAAEWTDAPSESDAVAYYRKLLDLVMGRIREADGAKALHAALADVVTDLTIDTGPDGLPLAEFRIRPVDDATLFPMVETKRRTFV